MSRADFHAMSDDAVSHAVDRILSAPGIEGEGLGQWPHDLCFVCGRPQNSADPGPDECNSFIMYDAGGGAPLLERIRCSWWVTEVLRESVRRSRAAPGHTATGPQPAPAAGEGE